MVATKRIPVSAGIWEELSGFKEPGQTFGELIEKLIEREKKLIPFFIFHAHRITGKDC
ncbi:MAG: hypothetical protein WBD09_00870 [Halobacteriota archaeon]